MTDNDNLLKDIMSGPSEFTRVMKKRTTGNAGAIAMHDVKRIKFDDVLHVSDLVNVKRLDQATDGGKPVPVFKLALLHMNGEDIDTLAEETRVSNRTMRLIIQSDRFQKVLEAMGEEVKNSALTYMKGLSLSAISTLADAMAPDNKMSDRIRAATAIIDRVGLNPVSKHTMAKDNSPKDAISSMTEQERRNLLSAGIEYLVKGFDTKEEDDDE